MKKLRMIPIMFLLLNYSILFAQEETKEKIPVPGDPYYGIIEKQFGHFLDGEIVSNTIYFTEKYANENGRISQSQFYINGQSRRYIMTFTDEYTKVWGISEAEEIISERGEHEKITYTFYNGQKFNFSNERLNVIRKFEPRLLYPLVEEGNYQSANENDKPILAFDTRGIAGSTFVSSIPNSSLPIQSSERAFIQMWLLNRNANDISNLYNKKIDVIENGKPITLLIQDTLVDDIILNESTVVYYYHLGALNGSAINIIVGYYDFGY